MSWAFLGAGWALIIFSVALPAAAATPLGFIGIGMLTTGVYLDRRKDRQP